MAQTAWTRFLKKHMASEMKHHDHRQALKILAKKYKKSAHNKAKTLKRKTHKRKTAFFDNII